MFLNRTVAGRELAAALDRYADRQDGIILGIPRGGVIVGLELSRALRLPLDVLITRKIGAPDNPELAVGAVAETGFVHLNEELLRTYPLFGRSLDAEKQIQTQEIARRRDLYRGGRPLASLRGRTVILVDDGVATGATYLASIQALRALAVGRLIAALPVAPSETVRVIEAAVDECVVLASPYPFYAVGQYYEDFSQVTDEQVADSLASGWRHP